MERFIFVATDSAYKGINWDDERKSFERMECVKFDAIPADEMKGYTPLCLFFQVGERDETGRLVKGIEKREGGFRVSGLVMRGRPLPFSTDFIVNETFSYPNLFDGSSESLANPSVTAILETIDEIISHVRDLETRFQKKLKLAEEYRAEQEASFEAESYEQAMENLAGELSKPSWMRKYRAEGFHSRRFHTV